MLHSDSWTAAAAVTFALSLLVSAIPQPEGEHASIVVPLRKRTSFVKSDGTFDLELAVEHAVRAKNKHRQNLINLERNVGKEAFNPVRICFRSSLGFIPNIFCGS
jgi:cathepsin D